MKTYTIGLPNSYNDSTGSVKNYILNTIAEQFPFFKWNTNEEEKDFNICYAGPTDRLVFNFNKEKPKFFAFNKRFWNPFKKYDTFENTEHYSSFDVAKAMRKLRKYAKLYNEYLADPGYDYLTESGEPVRIYKDFIQIGNTIIPFKKYGFYSFSPKKEENLKITNIIMNIYNNVEINAA